MGVIKISTRIHRNTPLRIKVLSSYGTGNTTWVESYCLPIAKGGVERQPLRLMLPIHAMEKTRIKNLSIIRSSRDLGSYELVAGIKEDSALVLAEQITPFTAQYDYIIIDPPPTLGILMVISLVAAHEVYIPMPLHFLAMEGLAEMMQVIYRLNAGFNPDLHLAGIIPTFFNQKTRTARKIGNEIKTNFGKHMLLPGIRNNIKLAESPAFKQTIFEYSPKSIGAQDYKKLITTINQGV